MNHNESNDLKQFIQQLVLGSAQSYLNNLLDIVNVELTVVNRKIDGVISKVPELEEKLTLILGKLETDTDEPNELW